MWRSSLRLSLTESEKPFTFHDVAVPYRWHCVSGDVQLHLPAAYGRGVWQGLCARAVLRRVWGDALSMYFGMWFGKRKMAPHVSPHKTSGGRHRRAHRQRACAGAARRCRQKLLGYAPNYLMLIRSSARSPMYSVSLGDLHVAHQARGGIKDYSHLFLTHGGMSTCFDSTMFIAPVVLLCGREAYYDKGVLLLYRVRPAHGRQTLEVARAGVSSVAALTATRAR